MSPLTDNKWKHLGALAACGLALAGGREFHVRSTVLLRQQEAEILRDVADLSRRIDGAHKTIEEVRTQQKDAEASRIEWERLQDDHPAGSPMVWVPTLVRDQFARSGTAVLLTRLNTIQDEPNLRGYRRGFWSTALPIDEGGRNIPALLQGVADLEQRNPCVRVLDFTIRPDPENPGGRVALLNLTTLIPK